MLELILAVLQVASPQGDWSLPKRAGPDLHVARRCPTSDSGGDVVVCGNSDPDRYRLKPLPQGVEKAAGVPLAQVRVGGGTLGVTTQQGNVGNIPTNRVMMTLKLPF